MKGGKNMKTKKEIYRFGKTDDDKFGEYHTVPPLEEFSQLLAEGMYMLDFIPPRIENKKILLELARSGNGYYHIENESIPDTIHDFVSTFPVKLNKKIKVLIKIISGKNEGKIIRYTYIHA